MPNTFNSLRELRNYKIGVVRGYVNAEEFDNAAYLTKEVANTPESNLQKLYHGRIDLMVGAKEIIFNMIKTSFPEYSNAFEPLEQSLQSQNVNNAFSKAVSDSQKLVADFNRGLQMLKDDGTYNEIMEKYGQ